ncbi:hypothetical protein AAFF_G00329040 [Aldrovandia affinis]|uniref:Uncharacterized protein n=1 Tax=Aldrovandia affinis TaxID=143900 RepID=A0AAD7WQ80_9TELE|nr:hypothetical protein AAFF_G00329040 [Aldrovandia affinis]
MVEEQGPTVESNPLGAHQGDVLISPPSMEPNQRVERREPGRRNKIKFPKANEAEVWRKLDTDLSEVLERSLHGNVEAKLNLLGKILYQECKDRFGEITIKQTAALRGKGRREKEINQLVQRRQHLRKNWRKATQGEKEGLKMVRDEVKRKLASLRRAEHIRKHRKRKEKERANFFKHARQLLEDKKSRKLEVTNEKLEQHIRGQYSDPWKVQGLFGRNILQLPLQSISLGYKQGKTRLVQELRKSTDQLVRCADAQVRTG